MRLRSVLVGLALFGAGVTANPAIAADPVPLSTLVKTVDIPFDQFALPNGLRVVVHTDRKAPVVAVSVWYHVGSRDEPKGKEGFAHLFEHLMFYGSENAPGGFFDRLKPIGATESNGTTSFERTNYFETVPTAALDRILFLESDRMGHLLGAVDQVKLDTQRGVVQNEKRQGDNQPFRIGSYVASNTLFPDGHPYHHSTIGSMADLNAANLDTVRDWFRAHYGPNNAVLVLAGDIDLAHARPLVERYFGDIARGPEVRHPAAPVPTLATPVTKVVSDIVPYATIERLWTIEGVNGRDTTALTVAASVLGGLSASRLDNALVRGDASAVSVTAFPEVNEDVGVFHVSVAVRPGQDVTAVGRHLDVIIADLLKDGPTADEVRRVATRTVSGMIGGFESVGGFGGKAVALAEGLLYSNDPAKFGKDLAELAAMTPQRVTAAARTWLSRPALTIITRPGARDTSPAMLAITGDMPSAASVAVPPRTVLPPQVARTQPPLAPFPALRFPTIERAKLGNGIPVYFARRGDVPTVLVNVDFRAGVAADPKGAYGLQVLSMALMREGTATLDSRRIAEAQERLGANLNVTGGTDTSTVGMFALAPNLAPSLDLLADIVKHPAFDARELERVRGQQLAGIAARLSEPDGVANFVIPAKLFGPDHPYGHPGGPAGTAASVRAITRDGVVVFYHDWIRPETAAIFVVGDTTMAALKPLLEARFGTWHVDGAPGAATVAEPVIPAPAPTRIYLVDRPQSPQSLILMGQVLAFTGKDLALTAVRQANQVLGGSTEARLSADLRDTRHWSYGSYSYISAELGRVPFYASAPVQADHSGDSVAAMIGDIKGFLTTRGTTPAERDRTIDGTIRELPGNFETSGAVFGGLQAIVYRGRPDDYYQTLADRLRALTPADLDRVARAAIDPDKLAIVVVGDAAVVRPQLDKLGLPVEQVQLPK